MYSAVGPRHRQRVTAVREGETHASSIGEIGPYAMAKIAQLRVTNAITCDRSADNLIFMSPVSADRIHRAILNTLQRDGRIANIDLAHAVSLSPSACLRRVKALEASGVIESYRAEVTGERQPGPDGLHRPASRGPLARDLAADRAGADRDPGRGRLLLVTSGSATSWSRRGADRPTTSGCCSTRSSTIPAVTQARTTTFATVPCRAPRPAARDPLAGPTSTDRRGFGAFPEGSPTMHTAQRLLNERTFDSQALPALRYGLETRCFPGVSPGGPAAKDRAVIFTRVRCCSGAPPTLLRPGTRVKMTALSLAAGPPGLTPGKHRVSRP